MKITNHETKNLFVPFLTGVALIVVLGLMVALSTSAFALGGGGGGGGSAPAPAPAPKITEVDDPVANPRDEVAEVKKPVVNPGGEVPDDKTPVGELKTKEPEEKALAIEDPDEDKTENKPDERTTEFPKPKVVSATVGFAASSSSMVEEGGLSEIQVRISKPLPQQMTLNVSAVGTATEDVDYKISSASLTIPASTTSGRITLVGLDDDIDEADETITLTLAGTLPEGVTFGTTAHTVTIIDDDVAEATVGFARRTTQMEEGEVASLRVVLSGPLPQPVTVTLSEEDDSLELSPGTVTFQPGETSKVVSLTAVEDNDSSDERVTVYLGGGLPDGVSYGEIHGHIVTITDDDVSGTVGFALSGNDATASEGDTVRLTVASSVAPAVGSPISFNWSVSPASEVSNAGGRVTIIGPATTGTFAINVANDSHAEIEEYITVTLSDGNPNDHFTLDGSVTHTITIPANDNTITFSAPSSASIAEEGGIATVTATINNPIPALEAATVTVIPHGSAVRGSDYRFSVSGGSLSGNTWTLPTGMSSATLTVTAVDNSVDAEDKTLTLGFAGASLPSGWSVGRTHAHTVTIIDNDVAEVAVTPVDETPVLVIDPFRKEKKRRPPIALVFDENGNLVEGGIAPEVHVGDEDTEDKTGNKPDERTTEFPKPKVVSATVGFATSSSMVAEGGGHSHLVEVRISEPLSQSVTLDVLAGGTALQGTDYTIPTTITIPEGSASASLAFTSIDDNIEEADEVIVVGLLGNLPEGVTFGASRHAVTIVDDDAVEATVGFAVPFSQVIKGVRGNLQVVLSNPLPRPLVLTLSEGSSEDGEDKIIDFSSDVLTFRPGETRKVASFTVKDTGNRYESAIIFLEGDLPKGVTLGAHHFHFVTVLDTSNRPTPEVAVTPDDETGTEAEDKTVNKPEVPKIVEASVGFAASTSSLAESGGHLRLEVRSGVLSQPLALDVVVGGTAGQGTDYTISSTSLTIPAGSASAFLTLTGIDDAIYETNETITLVLKGSLPDGMKFGTDTHTVTIVDDEIEVVEATVGFERRTTQMEEGGNASLRVVLSRSFPQPVTARLSMEGDADAFEFSPGTVTFQPGETSKVMNLRAVEDSDGADERVTLYLGGGFPDGVRHGEIHGHTVTIIDNDVSGTIGFAAVNVATASEGDTVLLTVSSSVAPAAGSSASFNWSVSPASEVDLATGTVTITGPARTGTFTINIVDDDIAENEERITVTLSDGYPHDDLFTIGGSATYTITIPANDQIAEVVEATVDFVTPFSQVAKGATGNLQVALSNPLPQPLTLTLSEGGGGNIIDFSSGILTFQPGETRKVASFTVRDTDSRYESAAIFLGGDLPEGVTLGAHNFHLVTILDTGNRPTATERIVAFASSSATAVEEGDPVSTILTVTPPPASQVSIPVLVTSTGEVDYILKVGDAAIANEVVVDTTGRVVFTLKATGDADEKDGRVTVRLGTSPGSYTLGDQSSWAVAIKDNNESGNEDKTVNKPDERTVDFPKPGDETDEVAGATVEFAMSSSVAREGWTVSPLVVLSGYLPAPFSLSLRTSGTASGSDFALSHTVLISGAGTTSVPLDILADAEPEFEETIVLTLAGDSLPPDVNLGANTTHTVVIPASDNTVAFGTLSSASIAEEGGTATITATIGNPIPTTEAATVTVTSGGSAVRGTDYRLSVSGGTLIGDMWTLPARMSDATLTVTAVGNSVDAENKTLALEFAGADLPAGWSVRSSAYAITIVDDDVTETEVTDSEDETPEVVEATVGFVMPSSTVVGGNETFVQVALSKPLLQPLRLSMSVGTNDIGAPDESSIFPDVLFFPKGETSIEMKVNTLHHAHQMFFALIGDLPDGVSFGIDTHTVNVEDPEFVEPTVSFGHRASGLTEGVDTGLSLQVRLNKTFSYPITVSLSGSGTGTIGEDVEIPGSVTFEPGEKVKLLWLVATDDALTEAVETITLAIGNIPEGLNLGVNPTHEITITDNDERSVDNGVVEDETVDAGDVPPPGFVRAVAGFATRRSEVDEGGRVELQVELSKPLPKTVALDISLQSWSTSASLDDVDSFPSTVTFPQGETTASVSFTVVDDSIDESDEELRIRLRSRDEFLPYVRARGQHTVTIIDNDSDVEVGFGSSYLEVDEGDNLSLQVELSRSLPQPLTLSVVGSAGSGDDIVLPDSVIIEQGERRKFFVVAIVDDAIPEANKMVTLSLEGELPDGVKFSNNTRDIIIIDNDSDVEVGFVGPRSWAGEGDDLSLRVELSRSLPQPLTLSVVGSAGSGDDIVLPDSVTIEQGERRKFFVVAIVDDAVFEGAETVTLSLEGELPDGVEFGERTHVFTIDDNDTVNAAVGFAKSSSEVMEGESLSVQVELSHAFLQSITLLVNENFHYDDIRVPGTLTFEPGETSKVLEISTVDNYVFDEDRTFRLLLRESWSNRFPEGVRFGTREHVITMIDDNDDMTVGFASSSTYVGEDVGSVAVEVVLGGPLLQPLRISFHSDAPLASNAPDADIHERTVDIYTHSHSLTFEPGETSKLLLFDLADDRVGELTEYYDMTLEGDLPDGMKFGRRVHTIYTSDNDRADEDIEDIHVKEYEGGEISVVNGEQVGRIETVHYHVPDQNSTISIENLGIVDTDVVARIFDFQNDGEILIKNATQGIVGGNVIGKQHGNGKISVENRGTVDGDIRAVQFRDGVTEIVNHGSVGENIEVTHYGDSEILITNYETATATAIVANHYGSGEISIANHGTAEVNARHENDNGIVRFAGNIGSGSWNELTGGAIHLGTVDFRRSTGEDVSTLEIYGDYEGSGDTRLNFHVGPDGMDYGRLWIDGDVTGQSRVSLIVDGEVAADTDFDLWELIEVDGEAQANSFYGAETVGAFDYVLEYEREGSSDHAWHFVNRGLSEVASQSSQTVDEIIKNMITPTVANPGERDEYWCLWGEQFGSHTVLGFEVPVTRLAGGDMFVGTSVARNSSTSSNISVESQITALVASWERGGLYVGGQTRLARFTSDVSTGRLSVVQNNGGTGISTSVETGYWFDVMNFRISPQVQLTWTRVGFDDFVGPHGELVSLEDGDRVTGQLGLSWDGEWQGAEGFGRLYGGMNLRGNLDGKTSVNVSGVSIASEQDDLSIDGRLGFSYEWNEGYAVRGEVSALRSDDVEEVRADLGVRIDF